MLLLGEGCGVGKPHRLHGLLPPAPPTLAFGCLMVLQSEERTGGEYSLALVVGRHRFGVLPCLQDAPPIPSLPLGHLLIA